MATGTPGTRRLLAPSRDFRGLATWGASSMTGEQGHRGAPTPNRIIDHLAATIHPQPLYATAIGGTHSTHNRVQVGVDKPRVTFHGGASSGKRTRCTVDHPMTPWGWFRCPGTINGVSGVLKADGKHFYWEPKNGAPTKNGTFVSAHQRIIADKRHLVWSGKNNISSRGGQTVIDDVRAIVNTLGGARRVIVLGQWITPRDDSTKKKAMKKVNDAQRAQFAHNFLDVQELLTTSWGLDSPPVVPFGIRPVARTSAVPAKLVAPDGIHLNGWGNRVVTWALIARMQELRWL